jgi:hypothetical protein
VCELVTLGTGDLLRMVVESEALELAQPPPATVTTFNCGEVALLATLTVTVIGG